VGSPQTELQGCKFVSGVQAMERRTLNEPRVDTEAADVAVIGECGDTLRFGVCGSRVKGWREAAL
jgi:hypothetical protein